MMQAWANGHLIESLQAQRELDMAQGILMGLRRRGRAAAYRELLGAAKRHRLGVNDIAAALVRNYRNGAQA
jgi:AmiR/NasT family two-component response regulator